MTIDELSKINRVAIGLLVSEKIMGWKCSDLDGVELANRTWVAPDSSRHSYFQIPDFSTDPAADYSVLVMVRETWDYKAFSEFLQIVYEIESRRTVSFMQSRKWNAYPHGARSNAMYQIGDYSIAALATEAR